MKQHIFKPIKFPKKKDRPYIITSFAQTMDGVVYVDRPGYWPIGSKTDWEFFTFLRAHCDAIFEAKNTALKFGKYTINTIHSETFQHYQKDLGIEPRLIDYVIVTSDPSPGLSDIRKNYDFKPYILTTAERVDDEIRDNFHVVQRHGEDNYLNSQEIVRFLHEKNYEVVYFGGGPALFSQLLQANLIDEIFITLTPRIFGSKDGSSIHLVENALFSPEALKFQLVQSEQVGDEMYLRYRS